MLYNYVRSTGYGLLLSAPGIRGKVKAQISEATAKLEEKMIVRDPNLIRHLALPKHGLTHETIKEELMKYANDGGCAER